MTPLIEQAIAVGNDPKETVEAWLDAHMGQLTIDLASRLESEGRTAGDRARALACLRMATRIYFRLGHQAETMRCRLRHMELLLLRADAPDKFQYIVKATVEIAGFAHEHGDRHLCFDAAVLIADAWHMLASHDEPRPPLLNALVALTRAADAMPPGHTDVLKFAARTAWVTRDIMTRVWIEEQAQVDPMLRMLAAKISAAVPIELEIPNRLRETVNVARYLSLLCAEHGQRGHAIDRMKWAMRRCSDIPELWLLAAATQYHIEREDGTKPERWVEAAKAIRPVFEQYRQEFRSRAGRLWAASLAGGLLNTILEDESRAGATDLDDVFGAVEALKSRLLLDQIGGESYPFPDQQHAQQARAAEQDALAFPPNPPGFPMGHEFRLISLAPLSDRLDRANLEAVENVYHSCGAGLEYAGPIASLHSVRQALVDDEAMVQYAITGHRDNPRSHLIVMVITRGAVRIGRQELSGLPVERISGLVQIDGGQPIDVSPMGQLVFQARQGIAAGSITDATRGYLRALYDTIIGPYLAQLPAAIHKLVLVPTGVLHCLPFAALLDEQGRFLVQRFALSVVPSASVWHLLLQRQPPPLQAALALGDPDPKDPACPPLPSARKEVEDLCKILPSLVTPLIGEKATKEMFRTKLPAHGIVHFAAHGEFPEIGAIDFHRIRLAVSSKDDGRLVAEEVRALDFTAAHLVTLSICNGGLYRFGPGDEPFGLMPAFLASGAQNVLGTLWPVDDAMTHDFMKEFYRGLLKLGPSEALRHAAVAFIKDEVHPRHWAGMVLVGTGRRFVAASQGKR